MEAQAVAEQPVTTEEMAAHLKVSKSTVQRLMRAGAIPSHPVGRQRRFWISEVEQALKAAS